MVLVPIMVAIFWKGRKTKLAGTLSCLVGLVSTIGFYLFIFWIGVENETYGTYIWSFSIGDGSYSIWQEYALFFTLPLSALGFLAGSLLGKSSQPPAKEATA
jgi:Na+/proline symporter